MEWRKIEQEWKKKVEGRTIAPSATAWDRLAQQLDGEEKKVKKLAYKKWMAIASCLLVGGLVAIVVMQLDSSNAIEDKPVYRPTEVQQVVMEERPALELEKTAVEQAVSKKSVPIKEPVVVESHVLVQQLNPIAVELKIPEASKTEEVETLLKEELRVQKTPTKVIVNSNNLLKQVEGEIEIEYRDTKLMKMRESAKKFVADISNSKYEEQN